MNIAIVAHDVGPTNALRLVGEELLKQGHFIKSSFGESAPRDISAVVTGADRLLLGISSTKESVSEELHAFKEAKRLGIPVAVFSDIYGAYSRSWEKDIVQGAGILFVIDEQEVEATKGYVGAQTNVVVAANPYWAEFFEAGVSRDEVRAQLGVQPEEKMILVAGAKELAKNVLLFNDVVMAARDFRQGLHLVLTIHPAAGHASTAYDDITKWSVHPTQFPSGTLKTPQMIAGADLVVTAGGSTVSIMAACQRVHVIDLMHKLDGHWWKELSGLDHWPPAQLDVSWLARDEHDLSLGIERLLDPSNRDAAEIRDAQETEFYEGCFNVGLDTIVTELTR